MLSKDSASREQNKISLLVFYAEAKPVLSKDSAIHRNKHLKKATADERRSSAVKIIISS